MGRCCSKGLGCQSWMNTLQRPDGSFFKAYYKSGFDAFKSFILKVSINVLELVCHFTIISLFIIGFLFVSWSSLFSSNFPRVM